MVVRNGKSAVPHPQCHPDAGPVPTLILSGHDVIKLLKQARDSKGDMRRRGRVVRRGGRAKNDARYSGITYLVPCTYFRQGCVTAVDFARARTALKAVQNDKGSIFWRTLYLRLNMNALF